jgi:hypothetical protein
MNSTHIAAVLLGKLYWSEFEPGRQESFGLAHAAGYQFPGELLDVDLHLSFEVRLGAGWSQE